jgi:succinate-acetate transporter protein
MARNENRIIDMTLEGEFAAPPPPPKPPIGARVMLWAIVAMVLAVTALIVALTFWFVIMILPVILLAAAVAYLAFRYQVWRAGRSFTIRRGPYRW